jgi:hypothetical protein
MKSALDTPDRRKTLANETFPIDTRNFRGVNVGGAVDAGHTVPNATATRFDVVHKVDALPRQIS